MQDSGAGTMCVCLCVCMGGMAGVCQCAYRLFLAVAQRCSHQVGAETKPDSINQ